MTRLPLASLVLIAPVALGAWASGTAGAGFQIQGFQIQGFQIQGTSLGIVRFPYGSMTKDGKKLRQVRIVKGELVGMIGNTPLSGAAFAGVVLEGRVVGKGTNLERVVPFRIASVTPLNELPGVPAPVQGGSFLYQLQARASDSAAWEDACEPDPQGAKHAVPVAAIWDSSGKRVESNALFTFGCTSGSIGKCYLWGYRPWYEAPSNPKLYRNVHQACTRMARGDYCGDGIPHTKAGTTINVWDNLTPPIQTKATAPKMLFESGWAACGALCLSRWRWPELRPICRANTGCLYRKVTAGAGGAAGQVVENQCDSQAEAEQRASEMGVPIHNFNESYPKLVPAQ